MSGITSGDNQARRFQIFATPAALPFLPTDLSIQAGDRAYVVSTQTLYEALPTGVGTAFHWVAVALGNQPLQLARYTLAQANALTANTGKVEGAQAYISNARKPGEAAAAGTGLPAFYSAAGPAGAGWYQYDLATLVTV